MLYFDIMDIKLLYFVEVILEMLLAVKDIL